MNYRSFGPRVTRIPILSFIATFSLLTRSEIVTDFQACCFFPLELEDIILYFRSIRGFDKEKPLDEVPRLGN